MFKHMSIKLLEVALQLFKKYGSPAKFLHPGCTSLLFPFPDPINLRTYRLPTDQYPQTSNVFKLFEKMVICRLNWFLEYHNILNISLSGIRHRHKTTDHTLRLHDAIHKSLANKHNVLSVLMWWTKKFFCASCLAAAPWVTCLASFVHFFQIELF